MGHVKSYATCGPFPQASCSSASSSWTNLVQLLEQYYHPSNGGAWNYQLASFLKHSCRMFMKQLGKQGPDAEPDNTCIPQAEERCYMRGIVKLAGRAQFSKDDGEEKVPADSVSSLGPLLS